MKPRLTAVLDLRRHIEDDAKREVGRLERERQAMIVERDRHSASLEAAAAGGAAPAMRDLLESYINAMRRHIADNSARITAHDVVISQARDRLAQAHREVKAIEAIRARDAKAELLLWQRREARANDEHAGRKRQESLI